MNPYRRKFLNKLSWTCAASILGSLSILKATGEKNSNQSIDLIIDADTANEVDDAFAIARALVEPRFDINTIQLQTICNNQTNQIES